MPDVLASEVRALGSGGAKQPIRSSPDSSACVCDPEVTLEPAANRNWHLPTFGSLFSSTRMTVISPSQLMNGLFTSNLAAFELPSKAGAASSNRPRDLVASRHRAFLFFSDSWRPPRTCLKSSHDTFARDQVPAMRGTKG
jgi:hypothetical protein